MLISLVVSLTLIPMLCVDQGHGAAGLPAGGAAPGMAAEPRKLRPLAAGIGRGVAAASRFVTFGLSWLFVVAAGAAARQYARAVGMRQGRRVRRCCPYERGGGATTSACCPRRLIARR